MSADREAASTASVRTSSIDLLRGAVMVLMVLDHARDFFFGMATRPTDLSHASVTLFVTRWVTHFCAPVFVFLAGTSARFYGARYGAAKLARFLVTRGLWLVFLELTIIRLCWIPDPGYHFTLLQVIWALGWSMVALAGITRLPLPGVVAVGAVIVAGHNLLDSVQPSAFGTFAPVWTVLHTRGVLEPWHGHRFFVSYPVLPWIGVMALGYGFGALFERPAAARRRVTFALGAAAIAAFVVIRAINRYGDPTPWTSQPRGAVYTLLSFINCEKYPPSLLFTMMTLGPALCVLALVDGRPTPRIARPLLVFGRVPLLFYVTHLALLRYTSGPLAYVRWGPAAFRLPPGHAGSPEYPLWGAYVAWLVALVTLYPLCRWFAGVKERNRAWWLSYL